ncbi:MAG: DDE-type integrase/transposase/recombinase [Planctomycetes bacterium]|nr:DDE-type integrase/transposase/recombinase [Planctomycetota bacterium]
MQIYQDLCTLPGLGACYETVKRAVRALKRRARVYCRMRLRARRGLRSTSATSARCSSMGAQRRVWLFAMTLCFSRYSYYELVLDQTVQTFLGAIRRGFEDLGGAPTRIKPDNLKSAVLISALGERYQEDFFRLCQHYGTLPDAARPKRRRTRAAPAATSVTSSTVASWDEAWSPSKMPVPGSRAGGARSRSCACTARRAGVPSISSRNQNARAACTAGRSVRDHEFFPPQGAQDCHVHVLSNYYSVPYSFVGTSVTVRTSEQRIDVRQR